MLHGGMANHLAALPFIAPLAERYRIVAPDLRGSGKSWHGRPLTFDQLVDDIELLLDHLGVRQAVVGGVSSGCGVALRFALRHPGRTLGLVLVRPISAGEARGYTEDQKATFDSMNAIASRALEEGVRVLRPLYANLPAGVPDRALAMVEDFDPASVVATSQFLASGTQPFTAAAELDLLEPPTLPGTWRRLHASGRSVGPLCRSHPQVHGATGVDNGYRGSDRSSVGQCLRTAA